MTIPLDDARALIAETRTAARGAQLAPLTIVVLDPGGRLVAAEREDGSTWGRFELAFGKASGALALGIGSRALFERAQQQAYFIAAATAALGGQLVPVPGGVLVGRSGEIVGAVGVSGDTSDRDEASAIAGIEACGYSAVPGPVD